MSSDRRSANLGTRRIARPGRGALHDMCDHTEQIQAMFMEFFEMGVRAGIAGMATPVDTSARVVSLDAHRRAQEEAALVLDA